MTARIKICSMQDILRVDESGDLELDRVREIVGEVAAAAAEHPGQNILIDARETRLSAATMGDSSIPVSG